MLKGKTKRGS